MNLKNLKIGKRLDAYLDGKISPSRLDVVEVTDIVPIRSLSKKHLRMWRKAIVEDFDESLIGRVICYADGSTRFFDWNCDAFVFAKIVGDRETEKDPMMFARRPNGSWYGVNWNYRLDVKGTLRKDGLPQWEEAAAYCGQKMKWNKDTLRYDYFDVKTGRKVSDGA